MRLHRLVFASVILAALTPACGAAPDTGDESLDASGADHGGGPATPQPDPAAASALLEIHALDIWAEPLPAGERTLTVARDGVEVAIDAAADPVPVWLAGPGVYTVRLSAPEHEDLVVVFEHDGSAEPSGARVASATTGHGASLAHATGDVDGRAIGVHRLALGLRHRWFSAEGRPARRGNHVEIHLDGESAWRAAYQDLRAAQAEVLAASWWWESDFELVRDPYEHAALSPEQRWGNTMLGVLESNPAWIRVLVGQYWGQDGVLAGANVDDDLLYWAEKPGDGIEYMGQANETEGVFWFELPPVAFAERVRAARPEVEGMGFDAEALITSTVPAREVDLTQWPVEAEVQVASYHQKFLVVDHEVPDLRLDRKSVV